MNSKVACFILFAFNLEYRLVPSFVIAPASDQSATQDTSGVGRLE